MLFQWLQMRAACVKVCIQYIKIWILNNIHINSLKKIDAVTPHSQPFGIFSYAAFAKNLVTQVIFASNCVPNSQFCDSEYQSIVPDMLLAGKTNSEGTVTWKPALFYFEAFARQVGDCYSTA